MKSNIHYFNLSSKNQEKLLDEYYIFDERNADIDKYIKNTKEIKRILITIELLFDKEEKPEIIDRYFDELMKSVGKYSNCSEFSCFVNACDNVIKSVKQNKSLLKQIVKRYFKKRILNEAVPEEWVQALLDNNSSRKKGKAGEKKLIDILEEYGYKQAEEWGEFERKTKCVAKFSKTFSMKKVRQKYGILIDTKKQNKMMDLIIKSRDRIFICEAKHINSSGGGQDKQISELIEIIKLKERNQLVNYIAFLDGNYSNTVMGDDDCSGKLAVQKEEIADALARNDNSYFVNTAGFNAMFSDLR